MTAESASRGEAAIDRQRLIADLRTTARRLLRLLIEAQTRDIAIPTDPMACLWVLEARIAALSNPNYPDA